MSPQKGPTGSHLYSFQDVVLLRSARSLLDAGVPSRQLHATLQALKGQLPSDRPLSAVALAPVGNRVVVQDESIAWEVESGQIMLDLDGATFPDGNVTRPLEASEESGEGSPDHWFDVAVELEGEDFEKASAAYRSAIALDPGHAEAHLNLGRLLHEAGRLGAAREQYRSAADANPSDPRPLYNLGILCEDEGAVEEAIHAYRAAVEIDGAMAEAHFNLSRLLEARGEATPALHHLAEYRRLVGSHGGS